MKKFLFALLLLPFIAKAQVLPIGAAKGTVRVLGKLSSDTLLILPNSDTTTAPKVLGGVIMKTSDKKIYVYTGTKWAATSDGALVTESDPTVPAFLKLIVPADTVRWAMAYVDSVKRVGLNVYTYKNGAATLAYTDSIANVSGKLDSVRRSRDSVYWYAGGSRFFAFIDSVGGEANIGANVGSGAQVFQAKVGLELRFKTILSANGNITITPGTNDITLTGKSFVDSLRKKAGTDSVFFYTNGTSSFAFKDSAIAGGEINTISSVGSGISVVKGKTGVDLQLKSLTSDTTIAITGNTNDVQIKVDQTRIASVKRLQDTATALRAVITAGDTIYVKNVGTGMITGHVLGDSLRLSNLQAGSNITLTKNADSSITIAVITAGDTIYVKNVGTGMITGHVLGDSLRLSNLQAGSNITLTKNADSSITFASTTYTPPSSYGLLYSQNTWSSLGDFARSGGAWGTSSNKIICSGGVDDFSRFLVLNTSSLTRWRLVSRWIVATPSGTTYGIGVGQQSVNANGGQPGLAMKVDVTNGVNSGKVYIYGGEGMGVKATSTSTLAFSAGDKIMVSLERNYDTVTAIAKNITTNATEIVLNYYYPQPTSAASLVFTPNTGEVGLINYGGSHSIDSIAWFTPEAKYSDLMLIGDSKIDGLYARTWGGRIGEQLNKQIPSLIIHSGSYDMTTQTVATINEIMKLRPKQVLMTRMSNDARFGLSLSTTLANIAKLKDSLTSIGSDLFFALFPENPGTNQTNQLILLDTLNDIYPGKVINTMGDLLNKPGSIYVSDGVHLSEYGNNEAVKSILNSGKLLYARPDVYERYVRKENAQFTAVAKYINKPYLQTADSLSIPYKKYVDSLVTAATSGGASTSYLDSVLAKGGRLSTNRTSNMGGNILTWDSVGGHYNKMQDFAFYGLQDKGGSWTLRHQTGTSGGQGYILTDYYNYTGGVIRFNALGNGYYNAGDFTFGSTTDFGSYSLQNSGALYQQGSFRLGGTRTATSNDVNLLVKGESDSTVAQLNFPIVQNSYTPTKTDVTNVGTSSVTTAYYSREGNKIEVWGEITIDPTATGNTQIDLSLPIASAITNTYDLSGSAVTYDNNQTFRIYFAGGKAVVRGNASVDASSHTYSYRYVYYYIAP